MLVLAVRMLVRGVVAVFWLVMTSAKQPPGAASQAVRRTGGSLKVSRTAAEAH
jgi:hypothetical protein